MTRRPAMLSSLRPRLRGHPNRQLNSINQHQTTISLTNVLTTQQTPHTTTRSSTSLSAARPPTTPMNPTISLPRHNNASSNFGGLPRQQESLRMPRFFKRLFKFPQMDFELAAWEMTNLLISPPRVFKSIQHLKATKNTYHRADPSFAYLLSFFMALTGIAWGVATAPSAGGVIRLTLIYVFVHLIIFTLAVATAEYFLVGRILGRRGGGGRGGRGLFGQLGRGGYGLDGGDGEGLEFGYAFDVAIRAFFPSWVLLYCVQFVLWPVISKDYFFSIFLGNTLYLVAVGYYTVITFLGYNALPFLQGQIVLLWPLLVATVLWFISLFGYNIPQHIGPVFAIGSGKH